MTKHFTNDNKQKGQMKMAFCFYKDCYSNIKLNAIIIIPVTKPIIDK